MTRSGIFGLSVLDLLYFWRVYGLHLAAILCFRFMLCNHQQLSTSNKRDNWREPMAQADMQGKVCLVTGSSSGLGKATAQRLAQLQATVILGCRDKERGEAALAEIKAASATAT